MCLKPLLVSLRIQGYLRDAKQRPSNTQAVTSPLSATLQSSCNQGVRCTEQSASPGGRFHEEPTTDAITYGDFHTSEIVEEHVLCLQCKESVATWSSLQENSHLSRGSSNVLHYAERKFLEDSAGGMTVPPRLPCHLCSLVLGSVIQRERQQPDLAAPAGPIQVTLDVSRSGGVTLVVQIGESNALGRMGELVVVPADTENSTLATNPSNPPFRFIEATAHIYRNAQLVKSLESEASFSLGIEWLNQCLRDHPRCTEAAHSATGRPFRLVDVGHDNGTDPRVVVMDVSKPIPLYLTLSHCWGGAIILRLLLENVDRLTRGVPMHELPKTFRDAVIITRRLG